jgi:hypothetical protein
MKAAMFVGTRTSDGKHLSIEDIPRPKVLDGHLLLKVIACGVCRTDLHIVEGDLTPLRHFAHPSLLNMQATRYDRSVDLRITVRAMGLNFPYSSSAESLPSRFNAIVEK